MRVLVVDHHPIMRAGLRAIIEQRGCTVVGEVARADQILGSIQRLAPDIVLLDPDVPGSPGLQLCGAIRAASESVQIIIFGQDCQNETVQTALSLGAAGCIPKDASASELEEVLEAVGQGRQHTVRSHHPQTGPQATRPALSPRQSEVLRLLAEGQSTKEAAASLGLSPKTVDVHRAQIMRKLDIHSVPGLVRYAIRTGMVDAGV